MQNAECRTQSAERRVQNAKRRTQSAECRVQNAERRTQNAECRTQSAECRAQSAERRVQSAERRILKSTLLHPTGPHSEGGRKGAFDTSPPEGGKGHIFLDSDMYFNSFISFFRPVVDPAVD